MAGGKGTRLYPYTKILPKPLIPLGDVTITDRIIASFQKYGCSKVFMVLNHKASMIRAYMADNPHDYALDFVKEETFLGTAGGIRLLKDKIHETFFLSNCDILLDADMECAYKTHKKMGNMVTIICAMKDFVIPYGVIETTENGAVTQIVEKPDYAMLVNTGVYVLEPEKAAARRASFRSRRNPGWTSASFPRWKTPCATWASIKEAMRACLIWNAS